MLVTPEDATRMLGKNLSAQPPIQREKIEAFKRAWPGDTWADESSTLIRFTCDGWLVDGQHRLTVIAETGTARQLTVAYERGRRAE
jgi:hypothetical protein